jgi:hypothetical protein
LIKKDKKSKIKNFISKNDFIYQVISILILSIIIPLVQTKIDKHNQRLDDYRFQYQQSILTHTLAVEKYDSNRFLSFLLGDKYIEGKHNKVIFNIAKITNEREKELLADSITLISLYPEASINEYKTLLQKNNNENVEKLRDIYRKQVENTFLTIKNNIQKDIDLWKNVRIFFYLISILLFFTPIFRDMCKKRNDDSAKS